MRDDLEIEAIKQTQKIIKKWFGHLARINEKRPAKQVYKAKVQGRKRQWQRGVKEFGELLQHKNN